MVKRGDSYYGLLQAFADALKLLIKEYVAPTQADIILFFLGPMITLFFSLLSFSVIPFSPSAVIADLNYGILVLLAVSSVAAYGVLIAGLGPKPLRLFNYNKGKLRCPPFNVMCVNLHFLIFRWIIFFCLFLFLVTICVLFPIIFFKGQPESLPIFSALYLFYVFYPIYDVGQQNFCEALLFSVFILPGVTNLRNTKLPVNKAIAYPHISFFLRSHSSNTSPVDALSLHFSYIKELYKDRKISAIPFKDSLLATCYNCLDKKTRLDFLKEWGSKSCIYLIIYKHDPLIYYIGRTNLFKRRFNNHFKAESGTKLHLFLSIVGWEHFDVSIIEECSEEKQGERENYYLQKYFPILNSVFSSSLTESSINITLKNKLDELRSSVVIPKYTKNIAIYVYKIDDKRIEKSYKLYNSMKEASQALKINITSISHYRNTSVQYRGKLFYTYPIVDFEQVFKSSKKNTPRCAPH